MIGQRPDREIRVNVPEFRIRNQTKTSNERQAAADQVPPSMVNDPAPIKDLAERLDDLTVTVAKSQRFEDLPSTLVSTWKLKPETYLDIKAATDTPQRRDNLHVQITKACKVSEAVLTREIRQARAEIDDPVLSARAPRRRVS